MNNFKYQKYEYASVNHVLCMHNTRLTNAHTLYKCNMHGPVCMRHTTHAYTYTHMYMHAALHACKAASVQREE